MFSWKSVWMVWNLKCIQAEFGLKQYWNLPASLIAFQSMQGWYDNIWYIATVTGSKKNTIEIVVYKNLLFILWHWKFDYGVRVYVPLNPAQNLCWTHYIYTNLEIITPNNGYDDEVNPNYMYASQIAAIHIYTRYVRRYAQCTFACISKWKWSLHNWNRWATHHACCSSITLLLFDEYPSRADFNLRFVGEWNISILNGLNGRLMPRTN